ncbi:MAG: GNAT family N-acetyltransferase [Flavobacteriales bacterium]
MNMDWKTRPFDALTLRDLHDVMRLRVDVFVVEQRCAYAEIDGRDPEALHILGRSEEGDLIAYARILPPDEHGPPHIGRVIVHADHRRHGLARTLMTIALEALQRGYGSRRSALAAQAHLERFYGGFGFVRQGPDYPWDGIPHVDMLREEA